MPDRRFISGWERPIDGGARRCSAIPVSAQLQSGHLPPRLRHFLVVLRLLGKVGATEAEWVRARKSQSACHRGSARSLDDQCCKRLQLNEKPLFTQGLRFGTPAPTGAALPAIFFPNGPGWTARNEQLS